MPTKTHGQHRRGAYMGMVGRQLARRGACAELERLEAKNMKRSKGQRVGTRSICDDERTNAAA